MCGIAGVWVRGITSPEPDLTHNVIRMTNAIAHRGPDGVGHWVDAEYGIALGHRRLAIIDLTETGHQPMISASGRYVCVFNGEIYNFQSVKEVLLQKGHTFRGHSDTEVMLAAIEEWGFEAALKKLGGMFTIALWDRQEETLSLARDRIAKKPLYYGWSRDRRHFFFGSELKALRAHPAFVAEVNEEALSSYVCMNYVPAPLSIYKDIRKLPGGCFLQIDMTGGEKMSSFWSVNDHMSPPKGQRITNDEQAIEELEALINDSIRLRMVSDVPLGAFLSGGIDSSLTVALAARQSSQPIKTYCIGFEDSNYNEAGYARVIADHLGAQHTDLILSQNDMLDIIPNVPQMYDEPLADSSQIPTYLVSALARKDVTVSLSGDGGDEIFGGYTKYQRAMKFRKLILASPYFLRALGGKILKTQRGALPRIADIISVRNDEEFYAAFTTYWKDPSEILREPKAPPLFPSAPVKETSFLTQMLHYDMLGYLPEDIMAKVDRASMAVSLEARAPLLDSRIIDFSWRIPDDMKIRDGKGKWILRQILKKYVPESMFERPKKGFGLPQNEWLRGPLKSYAAEMLNEKVLKEQGYFNARKIQAIWQEHQAGGRDHSHRLWGILTFQAWHKHWIG